MINPLVVISESGNKGLVELREARLVKCQARIQLAPNDIAKTIGMTK